MLCVCVCIISSWFCENEWKEISFRMEWDGQQGELSHTTICYRVPTQWEERHLAPGYYFSYYFAALVERRRLHEGPLFTPATDQPMRGRHSPANEKLSQLGQWEAVPAQPMRNCPSSANEKPVYFEFPVYSNGLLVMPTLSNSAFLCKSGPFLCFRDSPLVLPEPGLSQIAFLF